MNIPGLTDQSLIDLHALIIEALRIDDGITSGPKPFEVREHHGWRTQADAYEAELAKRSIAYVPIPWG